jgi:hypothetical protein
VTKTEFNPGNFANEIKPLEFVVMTVDVPAEIRNGHLLNTRQKCWCFSLLPWSPGSVKVQLFTGYILQGSVPNRPHLSFKHLTHVFAVFGMQELGEVTFVRAVDMLI